MPNHGKGFPGGSIVKNRLQCRRFRRCRFNPWVRKILWRRKSQFTPVFLPQGYPGGSEGKESSCNAGDLGLIPGLGEGMATYSTILTWRIPIGRGTWRAIVHEVARTGHDLATKPPPPPHGKWLINISSYY